LALDALRNYWSSSAWANDLEELGVPIEAFRRLRWLRSRAARVETR